MNLSNFFNTFFQKYHDFSNIVERVYSHMENFQESDKYKLYRDSRPDLIKSVFFDKNNKLRFKIILFAYGKGSKTYWESLGKFNLDY